MLILQRKNNEAIMIGDNIKITVIDIGNDRVKLAIDAPKSVTIARSELLEAADANKESATINQNALKEFKQAIQNKKL